MDSCKISAFNNESEEKKSHLLVQPSLFGHLCFGIPPHRVGALPKCSRLSGSTGRLQVRNMDEEEEEGLYVIYSIFIKNQAIYSLIMRYRGLSDTVNKYMSSSIKCMHRF